ncbi:MAG: tetrahydromethanopterin S-methyltransferase subunit H [Candidatus Bathyarchaeia archaeon]
MLEFRVEQKTFQIGKISVGGYPGKRPVVLVGSIFYHGHKIVGNEMTGEFNKKAAEDLINLQDDLSEKTGNPCMIDVVAASQEAMIKELDFVASITEAPILMDSPSASIRLAGLKYAEDSGLINRIVYNSILPEAKTFELERIKRSRLESAILLAYNATDFTSKGRIKAVNDLITLARNLGIKKPLIDTCVLDVPTLGSACKAILHVKNEWGYPAGAGTHNAIATWKGLKKKIGPQAFMPCSVSAAIMAVSIGADFILYGPIEDAKVFFPSVALVDTAYGQLMLEKGEKPPLNHPLFRIA